MTGFAERVQAAFSRRAKAEAEYHRACRAYRSAVADLARDRGTKMAADMVGISVPRVSRMLAEHGARGVRGSNQP